ncbi:hypothetical protein GGX14DRAFT_408417 [Mycena pura]|uniref:Uncharacterized protein n=1 Tax=Mycena pura TaxID=153505 RepID=A0AAD6UL68_9AGAR|nr:hypothetical protein GGX14DRAFT_408417 [Mycena pura]
MYSKPRYGGLYLYYLQWPQNIIFSGQSKQHWVVVASAAPCRFAEAASLEWTTVGKATSGYCTHNFVGGNGSARGGTFEDDEVISGMDKMRLIRYICEEIRLLVKPRMIAAAKPIKNSHRQEYSFGTLILGTKQRDCNQRPAGPSTVQYDDAQGIPPNDSDSDDCDSMAAMNPVNNTWHVERAGDLQARAGGMREEDRMYSQGPVYVDRLRDTASDRHLCERRPSHEAEPVDREVFKRGEEYVHMAQDRILK